MARIAFVTPSSGATHGIGDYVRVFAEEATRLGHEVTILSINEPHEPESWSEVLVVDGTRVINVHRWGQLIEYEKKCREGRVRLEAFQPDWVSLEFEFYCYASHGNLSGLSRNLPAMLRGYRLHVMVHELWVQLHAGNDLRERAKGLVRYVQFRHLMKKLKPERIHTSIEPYARRLRHLFPQVRLLPVPSNIHVDRAATGRPPPEILETMPGAREKYLLVILFGRIIPEWDGRGSLAAIDELARRTGREVRLISIGSAGYENLHWKRLVGQMPATWRAIKLGIREPGYISQTIQACDLGLSPTPFELSRKSGTTAAFLEHGLHVLFADRKPPQSEIEQSYPDLYRDQLHFADQPLPGEFLSARHHLDRDAFSAVIARQFLADLGM